MPTTTPISTRATNGVFAAVAVLASVGLLPSFDKSIWRDEGASLYSAHLSWSALWQQSVVVDRVLLPYYALLHLWLELSASVEWARTPSLLAYGLTVFLAGHFGNRLGGLWCGVLAAVVTATNPLMIRAALDARPYAFATLAATVSVVALIRWFNGGGVRWVWCFSLAAIIALVLQMFIVLAPLSVLVATIALKPRMFRSQWRNLTAPIGLVLAVVVAFVSTVASQQRQVAWIPSITAKQFARAMVGPASGNSLDGRQPIYAAVLLLLALITSVTCIRKWRRRRLRPPRDELELFATCLAWAALPTAALITVSLVKPIYVERYVTSSVPGMAIALGLLTTRAFSPNLPRVSLRSRKIFSRAALGIAVLVLVANSISVSRSVVENIQGAAQYLNYHLGPNAEMALPDHSLTAGVDYYLQSNHAIENSWPEKTKQLYIEGFDLLVNPQTLASAPDNVWLVNDGSVQGTNGFIAALKQDGFVRLNSKLFAGLEDLRVEHFRRAKK